MAKITGLKRWLNGETFNARAYMYEREAIISLLNAHEDLIQAMGNGGTKIHFRELNNPQKDDLFIDYDLRRRT